jgi:hypothetical protein
VDSRFKPHCRFSNWTHHRQNHIVGGLDFGPLKTVLLPPNLERNHTQ